MLRLYVQPKASRTRIVGVYDGMLKLSITAAPVDGKANRSITAFLAKFFQVPKKHVNLTAGRTSRRKRFALTSADEADVWQRLENAGIQI